MLAWEFAGSFQKIHITIHIFNSINNHWIYNICCLTLVKPKYPTAPLACGQNWVRAPVVAQTAPSWVTSGPQSPIAGFPGLCSAWEPSREPTCTSSLSTLLWHCHKSYCTDMPLPQNPISDFPSFKRVFSSFVLADSPYVPHPLPSLLKPPLKAPRPAPLQGWPASFYAQVVLITALGFLHSWFPLPSTFFPRNSFIWMSSFNLSPVSQSKLAPWLSSS